MPIQTHPSFLEPARDERLWRYMEFAKFAALVTTGGLWFANAAVLAEEDPFEGALPRPHYHRWTEADMPPEERAKFGGPDATPEMRSKAINTYLDAMSQMPAMALRYRTAFHLNCWHSSPHETAAMWKSYGKHDAGIAITTSLERMTTAFHTQPTSIYCGRVQYIDFETAMIPQDNLFNAILRKRLSFSSENEVRLAISDFGPLSAENPTQPLPGSLLTCSLDALIEDVWISPTAPAWLSPTVEAIANLASLNRTVRRSTLLDQPLAVMPNSMVSPK